ncbi:MAG: patatin-like phospholipase family protein [Syntrophomonadales bacterium]|jgi:NTE family protein
MDGRNGKIGLVLGAGSARGLAHIGVMQVLTENRIPFDFLVGSSMGALVAAVYACGGDLYMTGKLAAALNTSLFWDVGIPRMGFVGGKRIEHFLRLITKGKSFEELEMPLAVVATDIETGEKIVIREGPVHTAVRASISIPGVFTPVRYNNRLLVDGAVAERLPVGVARDMGAEIVLGVDVTFAEDRRARIRNTLDVILQAVEILERQIFTQVTRHQATVLIQPRLGNIKSSEFHRAEECIAIGRECAEAKLDEIRSAIGMAKPDAGPAESSAEVITSMSTPTGTLNPPCV